MPLLVSGFEYNNQANVVKMLVFKLILLINCAINLSQGTCTRNERLSSCTFEDFSSTPCPERLILSSDSFRILSKTDLVGCEKTVYLDLRECLSGIESNTFSSMDKLTHLIFDNNVLPTIKRNWFGGPLKLEYLSITNCSVEDIDMDAFDNLENLEKLRLAENKLSIIKYGTFNNLSIEVLSLSKNSISELQEDCLANIRSLKKLHLDQNKLTSFVAKDVLEGSMDNLEILWLHKNLLTQLSGVMLEGLNRLRVLNVGYNEIAIIEPSTFENTPDLQMLILKNNHLTNLDSTVFPEKGLKNLQTLYIDNNRLSFLKSGVLHKLNKLKSVVIGGNPWQCKCLDIILKWMSDNNMNNECDREYMEGKRPICVVSIHPEDECSYTYDSYYYSKYYQEFKLYPELPFCL